MSNRQTPLLFPFGVEPLRLVSSFAQTVMGAGTTIAQDTCTAVVNTGYVYVYTQ